MQGFNRRQLLVATATSALGGTPSLSALASPMIPRALSFPYDHGSHNDTQTEWWYLTGHVTTRRDRLFGFQLTFFRSRVDVATPVQGRLAPRQLLFAHAALTDVVTKRQHHDQRIARASGTPLQKEEPARFAHALVGDMDVHIGHDAMLRRRRDGSYVTSLTSEAFALDLACTPTQALLLQGNQGYSQKGPSPENASFYITHPQLKVRGTISLEGQSLDIRSGKAWLDHEWSEALLPSDAVGWDWIGMNWRNGAVLTAFQLRKEDGSAVWAGGSWRPPDAKEPTPFGAHEVVWTPLAYWRSPETKAQYPVQWRVDTPAGSHLVKALVNGQELDSRQSTGTVYWEGLSELYDASDTSQHLGMGYLEMTGYAGRIRL